MIKIIKGINDKDGFEKEVNNFMQKHVYTELRNVQCIYRESARQMIYIAIMEYAEEKNTTLISKDKLEELQEKAWMYEGLQ